MARRIAASLVLAAGLCITGCSQSKFSQSVWDPLNLQSLLWVGAKPVRVGIAREPDKAALLDPATWLRIKHTPWMELERELSRKLHRPVVVEDLKPFQVAAHLQSGRILFAWMPAADYLDLADEADMGRVMAVSERAQRRGLIVASAKSKIQTLADIKGRRFAFGPRGDPVLHTAALQALEEGGIQADDLAKEVLPVPGALQFHINSSEAAKEIIYGIDVGGLRTQGGVIEESEYEKYPDTGGRWGAFPTFSKDQFRILARTEYVDVRTIPDGPVVAGPEVDEKLVTTVRDFLVSADENRPWVLKDLGLTQFRPAPTDTDARNQELRALAEAEEGEDETE